MTVRAARSVILSAGGSCFVACPGCYNHFGKKQLAATRDIVAFLRSLHEQGAVGKLTVGGGDPLTRPDIVDLLTRLRDLHVPMHLDTVGTAFLGDAQIRFMGKGVAGQVDVAAVAELVDLIGIPVDGSTPEIVTRFRRHARLADQLRILDLLDEAGAAVCINTVAHAGNLTDLRSIAPLIGAHRCVRQWQVFQYMPIGPLGYRNRERYTITEAEFERTADGLQHITPPLIRLTPKSASSRKNRYLLIDSDGVAWVPQQAARPAWAETDSNDERVLIGHITDPATLDEVVHLQHQEAA